MIETLTWSLETVREQSLLAVRDLLPEQFLLQADPSEHHPAWVLGHLLLSDSYLLHLLGAEDLPPDFRDLLAAHGPASVPGVDSARYLPPATLIERLARTGTLRCETLAGMAAQDLGRPTPDATLARTQPTLGHHVHALVFHEAHHAGQLTAWRRRHGLPSTPWVLAAGRNGGREQR